MDTIQAFFFSLGVGGTICVVTWILAKKFIRDLWWCRAAFSILVAITVSPTCFRFWSDWTVWPAGLMLGLVREGGKNAMFAILYGLPPILLVAGLTFWASSIILKWHNHEPHLV